MGKASRWFRALFGLKKSTSSGKRASKWSFSKSYREKQPVPPTQTNVATVESTVVDNDTNAHAIAVAAATAAVAEAAVAAAQAAAAVVRLTSSSVNNGAPVREVWAAVKIQAAFRSYLARRALRALKGLVRLQALVRGHIVRKQTAGWLRQMQVLLRAQARARAVRIQVSDSPSSSGKSSHLSHLGPDTPEIFECTARARSGIYDQPSTLKRNCSKPCNRAIDVQDKMQLNWQCSDRRMNGRSFDNLLSKKMCLVDEQNNDKILEVDTGKSLIVPKHRHEVRSTQQAFASDCGSFTGLRGSATHRSVSGSYYREVQTSSCPLNLLDEIDKSPFITANNSPQLFTASSRGGSSRRSPFTPTRSDDTRSYFSGYSDCPSYMAYTECSRAKVRSLSAPRQRTQYERSSSTKKHSTHGFAETKSGSLKSSSLHANFTSKAYPGSGRLDRLGMPVRSDGLGYGRY